MPQFYIDSTDFSTATAIYSDALCTIPAQDGHYASCGVVRQQLNGTLLPYTECIDCKGYERPTLLLLDEYPGAAAAYSLRQISAYYGGAAVRVRRASDNFEQDIGFDANGDLDTSALATFCAGTDGYVVRWYDQSGNANDVTQATTSAQPKVYDSVTGVVTRNNKPHAYFNGQYLKAASTGSFSGKEQSVFAVTEEVTLATHFTGIGDNSITTGALRGITGEPYLRFVGVTQDYNSYADGNVQHLYSLVCPGGVTTIDDYDLYRNGSILTPDTLSGGTVANLVGSDVLIGHSPTLSGGAYVGYIADVIWYNSDQSTNRAGIETNINAYHNIYWDGTQVSLLDTYPNAAIAYDLTALNSAYTGPIVRVRRASDNAEQDIYAKQDGSLNVSGLESFCSGTDGFVATWYDQSGNGRNLTQTTTAYQPVIVDSGVVVRHNSSPSVRGVNANTVIKYDTDLSNFFSPSGHSTFESIYSSVDEFLIQGSLGGQNRINVIANNGSSGNSFVYLDSGNISAGGRISGAVGELTYQVATFIRSVNNGKVYRNGFQVLSGSFSDSPDSESATVQLKFKNPETKVQGLVHYAIDQSTDRVGIEASLNAIHNVYWDGTRMSLLDSYPFASGAYSVRALNSNYTGPVVRVRRSSDDVEKDIKALWDGELDVATLESFCSGTDGFVSVWYDQSGNGKDMSQAVTSNQPNIVLSGNVRRNSLGNVSVVFSASTSQGLGSSLSITGGANFMIVGDAWSLTRADIWGDGVGWTNGKVVRWEGSGTLVTMNPFAYTDLSSPQLDPTILQVNGYGGTGFIRANGAQSSEYTMNDHAINNLSINQGTFVYRANVSEFAVWEVSAPFDSISLESDLNAYHKFY